MHLPPTCDVPFVDHRPLSCNLHSHTCNYDFHMHTAQAHDSKLSSSLLPRCLTISLTILLINLPTTMHCTVSYYRPLPLSYAAPAFGLQLPRNDPTTKHPLVTLR